MISAVLDVIGAVLLLVGLLLITVSLYGLLRMTDTCSQRHAQGLATGPGVIAVPASSVATENASIITFAVLAIASITITSPTASNAIARAAHRRAGPGAAIGDQQPIPDRRRPCQDGVTAVPSLRFGTDLRTTRSADPRVSGRDQAPAVPPGAVRAGETVAAAIDPDATAGAVARRPVPGSTGTGCRKGSNVAPPRVPRSVVR